METRVEMSEACEQAANLYDALAGLRDRYTPARARLLRAAAVALAEPEDAAPLHHRHVDLEELLAAVSLTIGFRFRAPDSDGGGSSWCVDDETMSRLEAAYAPVRRASEAPGASGRETEGEPDERSERE